MVEKSGRHLTLGGTWQLPTLCRDSRCHLHNRERVRNQRTPQGRLSGVVFRETRWQGCNVVCGEDWRTRTNLFLSAAELVHPGLYECILVCVLWHLLHIEYQNPYSNSKVRTFLGSEGRPHNFKGLFKGWGLVLSLGIRIWLGMESAWG